MKMHCLNRSAFFAFRFFDEVVDPQSKSACTYLVSDLQLKYFNIAEIIHCHKNLFLVSDGHHSTFNNKYS